MNRSITKVAEELITREGNNNKHLDEIENQEQRIELIDTDTIN